MDPLDGLRGIMDELWDPAVGMSRVAPGAHPVVDHRSLELHSVRETALGAILDLRDGRRERAITAIRSVLDRQRPLSSEPWSGTFPVSAEEPPPPPDAIEWVHYDPNWRQFIGCTLACALEIFGAEIDDATRRQMESAIERAVDGEPPGRIPAWYTNPALMHAWLGAWVGARTGEARLVAAGEELGRRVVARVDRHGDVDEYNSPTYDGVDLFALALWRRFAPSGWFAEHGERIARLVGARLATLYHPGLGAICGPYVRAYAVMLDRSVSLAGQWLTFAGADAARVLPPVLDSRTDHVHDLWFLPLVAELADAVVPHVSLREVDGERRHVQRFGHVVAESLLDRDLAIGAERGRVPDFSRDQYVPFTVHAGDAGNTHSLALFVPQATATADCQITAPREASIQLRARTDSVAATFLCTDEPTSREMSLDLGPIRLTMSTRPTTVVAQTVSTGVAVSATWKAAHADMSVRVR